MWGGREEGRRRCCGCLEKVLRRSTDDEKICPSGRAGVAPVLTGGSGISLGWDGESLSKPVTTGSGAVSAAVSLAGSLVTAFVDPGFGEVKFFVDPHFLRREAACDRFEFRIEGRVPREVDESAWIAG